MDGMLLTTPVRARSHVHQTRCVRRRSKRRYAGIATVIKVSVKDAAPRGRVQERRGFQRRRRANRPRHPPAPMDRTIKFDNTARCCSTPNTGADRDYRIFGPVTREADEAERFMKIVSPAPEVL
jgi:large subunit ribosomal protein L14